MRPLVSAILRKAPFYFQIWRDRLRVSTPDAQKTFDDQAIVAIDTSGSRPVIAAFGSEAEGSVHEVVRPFHHPRLMVHEFIAAEALLKHALRQVTGKQLLAPTPIAIMHYMDPPEDGITDIEERVLKELGLSAGANEVHLWFGRPLTSYDLREAVFKDGA